MSLRIFSQLADYNHWANLRIFAAALEMPEQMYRKPTGVFFGSLHGTLNHLLLADRVWLKRLTGQGEHPNRLDAILYDDRAELADARMREDARLLKLDRGYRVVVPDQIGFGKSTKPDVHYSFDFLAENTAGLLDLLQIQKAAIVGHSMGGMIAIRFARLYPGRTDALVLEDPIGLEDYRLTVPPAPVEQLYQQELNTSLEDYRKYVQSYFVTYPPEKAEALRTAEELQTLIGRDLHQQHAPAITKIRRLADILSGEELRPYKVRVAPILENKLFGVKENEIDPQPAG